MRNFIQFLIENRYGNDERLYSDPTDEEDPDYSPERDPTHVFYQPRPGDSDIHQLPSFRSYMQKRQGDASPADPGKTGNWTPKSSQRKVGTKGVGRDATTVAPATNPAELHQTVTYLDKRVGRLERNVQHLIHNSFPST